jgi:hypothetical protein
MKIAALALIALSLAGATADAAALYYLEPWTATRDVTEEADRRAVADNIIKRVRIFCGDRFTDDKMAAVGTVNLHITYLKKVSGGARFLLGPFRGNSHIKMEMSVIDQAGHEVRSDLHRRGDGMLGSITFGVSDNKMLSRVARDVCSGLPADVQSTGPNVQPATTAHVREDVTDDQIVSDFRDAHEELKAAKASGDAARIDQAEKRMAEVRERIQNQWPAEP